MPQSTRQRRPNGHAGLNGRPNGHGPDFAPACSSEPAPAHAGSEPPAGREGGGVSVSAYPGSLADQAASDDARGTLASAPAFAAVAGPPMRACTAPEAYAAAAPPLTQSRLSASAGSKSNSADEPDEIPGGEQPLPADPGDFVDEVHRVTDLFKVWRSLLHSKDEKIRQRAVEKLTEMRYKGAAALADEPQRIIIDMPRPNRD